MWNLYANSINHGNTVLQVSFTHSVFLVYAGVPNLELSVRYLETLLAAVISFTLSSDPSTRVSRRENVAAIKVKLVCWHILGIVLGLMTRFYFSWLHVPSLTFRKACEGLAHLNRLFRTRTSATDTLSYSREYSFHS